MAAMKKVEITEGVEPIPAEIIAVSLEKIATGFDRLKQSGLTQKALVLLIAAASGETQTTVRNVLYGIDNFRKLYLVPKRGK